MSAIEDRRDLLESIAFGDDARVTPGDRLKALEQLREFESSTADVEHLSPAEALREIESLAASVPSWLAVARATHGGEGMAAIRPPDDPGELREIIDLQARLIDRLELTLFQRESALRRWTVQRTLSPAQPAGLSA